jgi:hypothetical protein
MTLTFLDGNSFTTVTLTNLRVLRLRMIGISPEGAPTCLAFFTDGICFLFGK